MAIKDTVERLIVWGNKEPILTIRRVVWIVTSGWWLFLTYCFAAISFALTIIGIPFVPQALKLAFYAFDPTAHEAVTDPVKSKKPLTIAANVVWVIFFGWAIFLGFLFAAIIQALTVVGLPTALTFSKLGMFALWPFGKDIRKKFLPTTIEELRAHKAAEKGGQQANGQQQPPRGPQAV